MDYPVLTYECTELRYRAKRWVRRLRAPGYYSVVRISGYMSIHASSALR